MQISAVLHHRNVCVPKGAYLAVHLQSLATFPILLAVTVIECYHNELATVITRNVKRKSHNTI
jgi:hypothetical protein